MKEVLICSGCGAENWNIASEGKSHDQPTDEVKGYEGCVGIWRRLPDRAPQSTAIVIPFPKREEARND